MYGRIVWVLALLHAGLAGHAAAQRAELSLGGGATFSGPDISRMNGHGMAAALLRFTPNVGARIDALYPIAGGGNLAGLNGDGVISFGAAGARLRPYLLGGGGVFTSGGETKAAVNGGLGIRLGVTRRLGLFAEGRYFRFFDVGSDFNDMIFGNAGLSIAIP